MFIYIFICVTVRGVSKIIWYCCFEVWACYLTDFLWARNKQSIKIQRSRSKRNLQSGAKIMRIIVTKQLLGPPFANINVGHEFEGLWTSSGLCYRIDMGKERGGGGARMGCLRIFCFWLSLFFVKLDLEKFSLFQTFDLVFDKAYSFYYIPIEYRLLL